ncbi:MAG: ABC transporter permease [Rhodobacteraceae bacterium]|nr:ABC transporter permease [Paracoccaceae bacterium]
MAVLGAPAHYNGNSADLLVPPRVAIRHRLAFMRFLVRAIARRYRLNAFGIFWTVLAPLTTLLIYLLAFTFILRSPWAAASADTVSYGLNLFAGLIVFWMMADVLNGSSGAIADYANLVKKAVFPVEILPLVVVGSAVFHTLISTVILIVATFAIQGHVPATVLLFPIVLLPFILLLMGIAWALAGIGVYLRDLAQVVALFMTAALFLSPILYPLDRLGPALRKLIVLNPVTVIVEQMRNVMLTGATPDWGALAIYTIVAWILAALGLALFRHLRSGFGDVL